MDESEFIGYVGPSELHDGRIGQVVREGDVARVLVAGADGNRFWMVFEGVTHAIAEQPEGMALYAVSEMRAVPPLRRFIFANWDDEDPKRLELWATGIRAVPA